MNRSIKVVLAVIFSLTFLAACSDDNNGVEAPVAEKANFTVTIENVSSSYDIIHSGVFNTPVGASAPGPLLPGSSYAFEFTAGPGSKLSFATMFVHSNDLFYAPMAGGIDLFDAMGSQVTGDITSKIYLWDAGTEVNQEPGTGADQAPRQSGPNTGATDANNTVRMATDDFSNLPSVSSVIKVTLTSTSSTGFMLNIENVSTSTTLTTSTGSEAVPLAPGVFVVHSNSAPLFAEGMADYGMGLQAVAEDGDPSTLIANVEAKTGLTALFAPGVFAVYSMNNPLFTEGMADKGEGLEALAEDGDPSTLYAHAMVKDGVMASGVFNTPVSGSSPAPLFPGQSYQFTFDAEAGDNLSFATMFIQSNDIFAAPSGTGIELFNSSDMAISGDVTSQIEYWDPRTEVNEEPGVGLNQAPRQSGGNTGASESGNVVLLSDANDGFMYPSVSSVLKVTIQSTPIN